MTSLFKSAALFPIEKLINRLLGLDPFTQSMLSRFDGKTLCVEMLQPNHTVIVRIVGTQLRLGASDTEQWDARIVAKASALAGLLKVNDRDSALVNPEVALFGDTVFVQEFYEVVSGIEVDWQESLSFLIGDVATNQLSKSAANAGSWARESSGRVRQNIDEYLHEESEMLPSKEQVLSFQNSLDRLKLRVDRNEARIARLRESLDTL